MHIPAVIESVDLADCYDSVSHPIVSIALQSFNVNVPMVKMMLGVLQKMCWHLRTSFGRSSTSFGGTDSDPSMGLGQGATSAPPAFNAQSTLMINGYKALGHGANLISAWTGIRLKLASLLYVDDSDLLHMQTEITTDELFLEEVQLATDDWNGIVTATGGSLKPPKCFWYMLSYIWNRLRALCTFSCTLL